MTHLLKTLGPWDCQFRLCGVHAELVQVIADISGNLWPDLGLEITDLRLQSGYFGADCVCL